MMFNIFGPRQAIPEATEVDHKLNMSDNVGELHITEAGDVGHKSEVEVDFTLKPDQIESTRYISFKLFIKSVSIDQLRQIPS